MKIKLFYQKHKQTLEEFETQVNDFMAAVEVIDVKCHTSTDDNADDFATTSGLLVLYR